MTSWYLFLSLHKWCSYGFRRCSSEVTDFHFEYDLAGSFKAIWLPVESDFGPQNPCKMRGHMTYWASSFQLLLFWIVITLTGCVCWFEACVVWQPGVLRSGTSCLAFWPPPWGAAPLEKATPCPVKVFTSAGGQHVDSDSFVPAGWG